MPAVQVSKSIQVSVSPEVAYQSVRDFKQWPIWSPWLIADRGCAVEFAEDGNSYAWDSEVIGSGSIAVKSDDSPRRIDLDLVFLKPWKSQADVTMSFVSEQGGTTVTWKMDTTLPFFMFFMKKTMEAGCGADFDRGLAMLKDHLEEGSVPSMLKLGEQAVEPISIAGITSKSSVESIGESMEADMLRLKEWIDSSGVVPAGKPLSIYHHWDIVKKEASYTVGFPVSNTNLDLPEGIQLHELPEMETFTITHTGPYRHLGNAWATGMMHARAKQFCQRRGVHPFEIYENMPGETPDEELVTVVHFPIKN
ncbi:MAG: SRPBCC family protein [Verrucomicrobiota bacterium]